MMDAEGLLQAIAEAQEAAVESDGGLRFLEIQEASGLSKHKLSRLLHQLVKEGKAEAYRAPRPNIIGEPFSCVVYRLL